jgi:hypothetical protein
MVRSYQSHRGDLPYSCSCCNVTSDWIQIRKIRDFLRICKCDRIWCYSTFRIHNLPNIGSSVLQAKSGGKRRISWLFFELVQSPKQKKY